MRVIIVPCLSDNYAYLLVGDGRSDAVVVDPGEAEPVLRACNAEGLQLAAILNTHHHWDHVGGNEILLTRHPSLRVFGHVSDRHRIFGLTDGVEDDDLVETAGLKLKVLHVPGHTLGAIAYWGNDCAFTGDTLFGAGCGRLFEGTAAQLFHSLNDRLARLPPSTRLFCGHEYTEKNLDFAATVEPANPRIRERLKNVERRRSRREPTVPSTLAEELATNPFLRADSEEIRSNLRPQLPPNAKAEQVFAALRAARNQF